MRLICPNCAAAYDVPDDAIPPEGRAVECAGCGHGWHQPDLPPLRLIPAPGPAGAPRTPDAVLSVLREEAAREIAAREAGRAAAAGPAPRPATPPAALPDPAALAASLTWGPPPEPEPEAALPLPPPAEPALAVTARRRGRGRGWRAGFNLAVTLAVLLVALYAAAPWLAARSPAAAPLMDWRGRIDAARTAWQHHAEDAADAAIMRLRALAGR